MRKIRFRAKQMFAIIDRLIRQYRQDVLFSRQLADINLKLEIYRRLKLVDRINRLNISKNTYILGELKKIVEPAIQQFQKEVDRDTKQGMKSPIWIFWWSGREDAPKLVQNCIRSIYENAGNHPVYFLCEDNYQSYLEVPTYIIERVRKKEMCLAHFSDYIRFSLLNRYGGIWIDATVYLSQTIPEECFERTLYTCNTPFSQTSYVSIGKWTSFLIGGTKENILFQFMQLSFEIYWKQREAAIDYLLADYLIRIAYDNIPTVRESIDRIPINNLHRNDLRLAMNRAEHAKSLGEILHDDTFINKLSWRERYELKTPSGDDTVFSAFLKLYE